MLCSPAPVVRTPVASMFIELVPVIGSAVHSLYILVLKPEILGAWKLRVLECAESGIIHPSHNIGEEFMLGGTDDYTHAI